MKDDDFSGGTHGDVGGGHSAAASSGATGGTLTGGNEPAPAIALIRVHVDNLEWKKLVSDSRVVIRQEAEWHKIAFTEDANGFTSEPRPKGDVGMLTLIGTMKRFSVAMSVVDDTTPVAPDPSPAGTEPATETAATATSTPTPAAASTRAVEARVWISPTTWQRLNATQKFHAAALALKANLAFVETPVGAMVTPHGVLKGDARIQPLVDALNGAGFACSVLEAPAGEPDVDADAATNGAKEEVPRGAARAARRAESAAAREEHEDGDADDGIDPKLPSCPAGPLSNALNAALKATPRKEKDAPTAAFLVIACEGDRIVFAGRDGHRYHQSFCETSKEVKFRTLAITLKSAKELHDSLQFAVKQFPKGARVRFAEHTGSELVWAVSCAKLEPMLVELHEVSPGKAPEDWKPPAFTGHDAEKAALSYYDAKHISEATSWRGGGAIVKRDEVDDLGRRHINLSDIHGSEILRAVVVPRGQTEGLPRGPQTEIPDTLTPGKRAKKGSVDMTPGVAAGPAVKRAADGKWRVERSSNGVDWHTIESGTSTACLEKFNSPAAREGGAWLRIVRPDGTPDKKHEGKSVGMSARDKRKAAKSAPKAPRKRLETNVSPVGARKPARLPKPTARAKKPAKSPAKKAGRRK